MRYSKALFAAAVIAASAPSQASNWSPPLTLTTQPSVRRSGAMAYDGTRLILFGGTSQSPSQILNETWAFNGQWTLLAPLGGAPGRWGHQMVRNTLLNRIITFGGRSPTISGFSNDTYTWNGSVWSLALAGSAPTPRYLYGMAYDSVRDRVVVFGGRSSLMTLGDTWEGQVTVVGTTPSITWQLVTTAMSPPPREEMLMVYDSSASAGRTLLFGGYDRDTDTIFGDTWAYNGANWVQLTPETSPTPRYRMASAFDSFRMRTVMYGGFDGNQILQETYEFRADNNWRLIATANPGPVNATEMYAGYDPAASRRKFVTFGGAGPVFSNQTHEYTSAGGGLFVEFGSGCPIGMPEPQETRITCAPPLPIIGQTFNLTFAPLPTGTDLVLAAIGFSEIPPVDLGFFGLPGCVLVVSPDMTQVAFSVTTPAVLAVPIPNNPAFINTSLYFQGLTMDLQAPSPFLGVSRAGRVILGN